MEVEKKQACSVAVDYVIDQFTKGNLEVGEKLPPERDLAELLNISRCTVREAIKVLQYLGFVDSAQGSGNYITDSYDKTISVIMRVMYLRGMLDYVTLTEFRRTLELQAAFQAIDQASEEQLKEMEYIVSLMDVTTDNHLVVNLDKRLHTLIVEAARNPLIIINYTALSDVLNEYMSYTRVRVIEQPLGYKKLQQSHHGIVSAIRNKDHPAVQKAIDEHYAQLLPFNPSN